ncbi:MAG: YicC family protein [Clostridia bacterium]|nr:YicC family protein [Clostridia bacterium]
MIKSMTGYGRGEKLFNDYKITVEIKSVNNRYLDYNIRMYKQYSFVEDAVRECLATRISRGKVDVFIQYDTVDNDDKVITLNTSVAKGYYDALKAMGEKLGIRDDITVSSISRFPDVFNVEKCEQDKEQIIADTKEVMAMALDDISANRAREGARLYDFFVETISGVRDILDTIKERSNDTVDEYKQRMRERIEELLNGVEVDETRLLTEVAIFSDKVNITEELVRFESHLNEYSNLLKSDIPVGRKLDFTIQELNREANTMGSKCNDFIIGKAVVDLKSEIEKLREQVQNIE